MVGHAELTSDHNRVSGAVVDAAFRVHNTLGPGLLESVYEHCLVHELASRNLAFSRQLALPIVYRDLRIDGGLRLDLLVETLVVVEIKAVERLLPIHEAQLLTYLKLSKKRLGLLINFNVPVLKDGLRRMAL
jgi:GxxExxY protein